MYYRHTKPTTQSRILNRRATRITGYILRHGRRQVATVLRGNPPQVLGLRKNHAYPNRTGPRFLDPMLPTLNQSSPRTPTLRIDNHIRGYRLNQGKATT
jgi:hypothetical protein